MNKIYVIFGVMTLTLLLGCKGDFTVTAKVDGGGTSTGGGGGSGGSSVAFAGISSADLLTNMSVRLNWTHVAGAAQYVIYNVTSGTPVLVTSIAAPTATYNVTGLTAGTAYRFRVRLVDTLGLSDGNTTDQDVTTVSTTSTFNGWTHIKAVGPKTPAAQGTGIAAVVASTTLSWAAVTVSAGAVASYNIYRSTTSGAQDYTSPLAVTINAATRIYTDSTVVAGTTYYYTIMPVVAGAVVLTSAAADREVKVIVPRDNMVLLHRWAANKEICDLMGKAIQRSNNYRCVVATGANAPPGTGGTGFMDIERSIFVDMFEQGCNYTASNACTDASVNGGAASPCIGIQNSPNGIVTAATGSIYYSRRGGGCYFNTSAVSGTSWTIANNVNGPQKGTMGSAAPGLPPFGLLPLGVPVDVCRGQTVAGFAGAKRLIRRKEFFLAAAWDSSIADATLTTMENGVNLHTTGHCNTNSASPQGAGNADISGATPSMAYSNAVIPTAMDTLPGCRHSDCSAAGVGFRSLRTGSIATQNCVSRYGAQDLIGNLSEWVSDTNSCNGATCVGTPAASNGLDATNSDMESVAFDGTQMPLASNSFTGLGRIQLPLGIPIANAGFTGDGMITLTAAQFHGDGFGISVASGTHWLNVGGSWTGGTGAGRFNFDWQPSGGWANQLIGFRCSMNAE